MTTNDAPAATPPFWGTCILDPIPLHEVEAFLDTEKLFASRWQFRQGQDAASWVRLREEKAAPILARILAQHAGTFTPKIIYGYFRCERQGNGLIVHGEHRALRFDFPRERAAPNRCVADFFAKGVIAIQLATVGKDVVALSAAEFATHRYSEAFYLKGLAAELAEATAAYGHARIRRELGAAEGDGARLSPGYPSFPDLLAQKKIAALLAPARIGVALTETCQLVPEYSTTAIISVDPRAQYFRP